MSFRTRDRRTALVSVLNGVVIAVSSTNVVGTTRAVDIITASGTLAAGLVVFVVSCLASRRKSKD